ncbi:MAG: hypothetical protein IT244_01320 [Bacteroidia bacterium]|nr:hypothetical protein [Bacteroidia bacterium]
MAQKSNTETYLGMTLATTSREERLKLNLKNGVRVSNISKGVFKDAGIESDFVITQINNEPVYSAQGAIAALKSLKGAVAIEGKTGAGVEKILAVKIPANTDSE